ncbi:MAG: SPOR domain-containing protein [Candidatus Omnitrophota bacterium]|jgi:cell division septation protein DedD
MGFFSKKKNADVPSSVLSESEIQKKLYGEFFDKVSHTVVGDREHFKESAPAPAQPKESFPGRDAASDLFSAQKEAPAGPELSPRQVPPEQKSTDHASRHVLPRDFEKKPVSSTLESSGPDTYPRFRYNRPQENKRAAFLRLVKGLSEKTGELSKFFLDPKRVAVRRFFYWGVAALVVFLLFWGVNALNSQREEAMRARYKISGESILIKTPAAVAAVVSSRPAEHPVVITPVAAGPKKGRAPEGSATAEASANGSYVIQVVTYPTRQDADQIVDTFQRAGLHAFVKENTRPSGRLFYLVLLGGFHTEAEAQAQLLKFRAKEIARPFQDAFVKSNRS